MGGGSRDDDDDCVWCDVWNGILSGVVQCE